MKEYANFRKKDCWGKFYINANSCSSLKQLFTKVNVSDKIKNIICTFSKTYRPYFNENKFKLIKAKHYFNRRLNKIKHGLSLLENYFNHNFKDVKCFLVLNHSIIGSGGSACLNGEGVIIEIGDLDVYTILHECCHLLIQQNKIKIGKPNKYGENIEEEAIVEIVSASVYEKITKKKFKLSTPPALTFGRKGYYKELRRKISEVKGKK